MEDRANVLREMRICRFCLSDDHNDLTNIHEKSNKDPRGCVPLPLQIMACVAIEVFQNDGMPQLICSSCRLYTNQAYIFKTNSKKADDALKLFLATGQLSKPYLKPYPQKKKEQAVVHVKEIPKQPSVTPKKFKIIRKANAGEETPTKKVKNEDDSEVITLDFRQVEEEEPAVRQGQNADEVILGMDTDLLDESVTAGEFSNSRERSVAQTSQNVGENTAVKNKATGVFACDQCERSFPLKQLLDLHAVNHDRERSFECDFCDKKFFTKYDMQKHHSTHMNHKPYDCTVCEKTFSRETLLRRHEKVHSDVVKYLCSQCDKSYLTKLDLDLHIEKHKKKRAFTCAKCDKSFVFKQGLERHVLTHQTEKPYKCNYCEASFASAIKLTRHITSHAGLRPYPCKICARTFLLSHHLTRHMRSHYASQMKNMEESLGRHKCDSCSMSFRRKDSLINHSAIHSMVNLRCVICNTSFESAREVKEHITSHLSGLPFPCERCDYSFETAEHLEEHELKHAEMEYEDQIEKEVVAEVKKQLSTEEESMDEELDTEALPYVPSETNEEDREEREEQLEEENANEERREEQRKGGHQNEYVSFLKDEITSDAEDEQRQSAAVDEHPAADRHASFKPIVRTEGTKVYRRKAVERRLPAVPETGPRTAPLEQITQRTLSIDAGTLAQLPQMPDLRGARVQRLIITKEEMKQMAKRGLITVKNGMVRAKGGSTQPILNAVSLKRVPKMELDDLLAARPRPQIKQYQRTPSRYTDKMDDAETIMFAPQAQATVVNMKLEGAL